MSEQPKTQKAEGPSDFSVIVFMIVLCVSCALVLSVLTSVLKPYQDKAEALDRSKEILISAQLYNRAGYFQLPKEGGGYQPAKLVDGILMPASVDDIAAADDILAQQEARVHPYLLVDGKLKTFKEAGTDLNSYLAANFKSGYAAAKQKLLYVVTANQKQRASDPLASAIAYILPVNGQGLWAPIYGYISVGTDGNSVLGISWYRQAETPGLGALIGESSWQSHFVDKKMIFLHDAEGKLSYADAKQAPLGISVVKGKAVDVAMGNKGKLASSVDGMSGATITGNGVTSAYKVCLEQYRPFLLTLYEKAVPNV